ncbi:MAG: M1 family metallopeptidase [Anaerolineae bacterium]|nr:M1 family metallopeptidase [Anaerolineae bacterium]
MKPLHYEIHLEPDLETFAFLGRTQIEIVSDDPTNQIALNANDLAVHSCVVKKESGDLVCDFSLDTGRQELVLTLPEEMAGKMVIEIEYTGQINDLLAGFYRSKYSHNGADKYIAVTQFEERDARRAFPCFDHPAQKATFDIQFVVAEHLTAISNTPIILEESLGNGKKLVKFERTPKMSTYLLFFGVGEFDMIEDASQLPVVRVFTTPGKTQYGKFALDMARKSLEFGEVYTGIKFPISKCDYIAVPDFAFGAMENYGAITFRENLLLVYPGITSKPVLTRIARTIAHETAHMWFGDLVSPKDWQDLWLNESFATFFTHEIPDHYYPEWHQWDVFIQDSVIPALDRDALKGTVPIELPGEGEVVIDASSAPIIYNKGASVIRMLINYLDEALVKKGINYYLDKYKFDNASSEEFWNTFMRGTGEPVLSFAEEWINQPGYPLVEVTREGNQLQLSQDRFSFSYEGPNERREILRDYSSSQKWRVPLQVTLYRETGEPELRKYLFSYFDSKIENIPDDVVAFKLNSGQAGFYRVKYDAVSLEAIKRLIQAGRMPAVDRFGIESDLFALVMRGDYTASAYLDFIEAAFMNEDGYLALFDITRNLLRLHLLCPAVKDRVRAVGQTLLDNALENMGLEPQPDEDLLLSGLRDILLWTAFALGSEKAATFGRQKFQALLEGQAVHEDIISSVLRIGAMSSADRALAYFKARLLSPDVSQTEKVFVLRAMACLGSQEALAEGLKFNSENVPQNNQIYTFMNLSHNPVAKDLLWPWFVENLPTLKKLHPSLLAYVIIGTLPVGGLGREAEVKAFMHELMEENERARNVVVMALEMLDAYGKLAQQS